MERLRGSSGALRNAKAAVKCVRLFNLASDVPSAGLKSGAKTLADGIKYTLGSTWAPVSAEQQTFTAVSDVGGASLATATTTPPTAPEVPDLLIRKSRSRH